jgi:hypothetical protein
VVAKESIAAGSRRKTLEINSDVLRKHWERNCDIGRQALERNSDVRRKACERDCDIGFLTLWQKESFEEKL